MTKSIVTGLLAFAVSSSLVLAQEPATAGSWSAKPGSGLRYDGGDAFSLKLASQLQLQWAFAANEAAPDTNNFDVRRARVALSGHAFNKDLTYLLRLDANDDGAGTNGAIKDGWVQWTFSRSDSGTIGLRMGQGKTGHGLEATGSSTGLFFVERSLASEIFSANRSRGAWVHGSHQENKLRWSAGVQNGDMADVSGLILEVGEEADNVDNELNAVANVSFDLLGDMTGGKTSEGFMQGNLDGSSETRGTVGGGVFIGNGRNDDLTGVGGPAADTVDTESTQFNINTAWTFAGGFSAQAELFSRTDELDVTGSTDVDTMGWYAMGGYTLPKSADSSMQWGFGGRIGSFEFDDGVAANDLEVMEVAGVVNAFYHGHAAKTQIEVVMQDIDAFGAGSDSTDYILRLQFQLLF